MKHKESRDYRFKIMTIIGQYERFVTGLYFRRDEGISAEEAADKIMDLIGEWLPKGNSFCQKCWDNGGGCSSCMEKDCPSNQDFCECNPQKPKEESYVGCSEVGHKEECPECIAIGQKKCSEHCQYFYTKGDKELKEDLTNIFLQKSIIQLREEEKEWRRALLAYLRLPNLGHEGEHIATWELTHKLVDLREKFL